VHIGRRNQNGGAILSSQFGIPDGPCSPVSFPLSTPFLGSSPSFLVVILDGPQTLQRGCTLRECFFSLDTPPPFSLFPFPFPPAFLRAFFPSGFLISASASEGGHGEVFVFLVIFSLRFFPSTPFFFPIFFHPLPLSSKVRTAGKYLSLGLLRRTFFFPLLPFLPSPTVSA